MNYYGNLINTLIEQFSRLPGVSARGAQRIAFHIINNMTNEQVEQFSQVLVSAKNNVKLCKECYNLSDNELCDICANPKRDSDTILVVESPRDMAAYEAMGRYKGKYHILHGVLSPLKNIGPDELKIRELLARIKDSTKEIIIATKATAEGDATAMYLSSLIRPLGVKLSRIAYGVPVGGELEFVDQVTLSRALEERREI